QERRHVRDDLVAHEHRQHEDVEPEDEQAGHAIFSLAPEWAWSPRTISSFESSLSAPSLTMWATSFSRLRANIWLEWVAIWLGRLTAPTMVTPWTTTRSPGLVSSQLPPCSAARSTMTAPGCIFWTMAAVTRIGARLPGMSAVVMQTSARPMAWSR